MTLPDANPPRPLHATADDPAAPDRPCVTDPSDLTPRQRDVAALVARAMTNKQIAATLDMKVRTVRFHVEALEFLLGLEKDKNTKVLIAIWWRSHHQHAA